MSDAIEKLAREIAARPSPIIVKRRYGTISAVNDGVVDITLAGGEDLLEDVPYFNSYEPIVEDDVWVDIRGNDVVIVGSTSTPTQNTVVETISGTLTGTDDDLSLNLTLPSAGKWQLVGSVRFDGQVTGPLSSSDVVFADMLLRVGSSNLGRAWNSLPPMYNPTDTDPLIAASWNVHAVYDAVSDLDLELVVSNSGRNTAYWQDVATSLALIAERRGPAEAP